MGGGGSGKLLCSPHLSSVCHPHVLVPLALFCHLPDCITGDSSWLFTTGLSEGLLTTSEPVRKVHALSAIPARSQFLQSLGLLAYAPGGGTPGRRQHPGIGSGRAASGVFLPACPWTSEVVWQPPCLRLRGWETCLGMSAGAGWPGARVQEDAGSLDGEAWPTGPESALSQGWGVGRRDPCGGAGRVLARQGGGGGCGGATNLALPRC